MNNAEATELVISLLSRIRGIDRRLITPTTNLAEDLGIDSLDASELLAGLHAQTGRQLGVRDISDLITVSAIADALTDKVEVK
jgi:acyl carrier protein